MTPRVTRNIWCELHEHNGSTMMALNECSFHLEIIHFSTLFHSALSRSHAFSHFHSSSRSFAPHSLAHSLFHSHQVKSFHLQTQEPQHVERALRLISKRKIHILSLFSRSFCQNPPTANHKSEIFWPPFTKRSCFPQPSA